MFRPGEHLGRVPQSGNRLSRRQFLIGAGGAAVLGAGAFEAVRLTNQASLPSLVAERVAPSGKVRSFHSLPHLRPATIAMDPDDAGPEGYLFVGPWSTDGNQSGPMIVDGQGDPVWFQRVPTEWETNFRTAMYRGRPVLAWWQGIVRSTGFGQGEGVLVDSSYREVARIRAAGGRSIDLHEFTISPQGTALFTCYPNFISGYDLSSIGGPQNAQVIESVFQEVDIQTGRLLLEWRSLEHIPVTDSYNQLAEPYDYLHLNSIDVLPDGHLLVSGRYAWSVYKVHRQTGEVMWRLGGKRSQFHMGADSQFSWQHHASQPEPGTITVFDNGSNGIINTRSRSRGVRLAVDERSRTVRLTQSYTHPKPLLSQAMGSVQLLPDGNVQVGWGEAPFVTEFNPPGRVVNDARMLSGYKSYRSYRLPWTGRPLEPPAISARRDPSTGKVTLYASWNGATGVALWRVHGGASRSDLRAIGVALRRGFETAIDVGRGSGYLAVTALDDGGRQLGKSAPIKI